MNQTIDIETNKHVNVRGANMFIGTVYVFQLLNEFWGQNANISSSLGLNFEKRNVLQMSLNYGLNRILYCY